MRGRAICLLAVALALTSAGVLAAAPSDARAATTRTVQYCTSKTIPLTGWQVFTVCLTATDSFDGSHVSGYVSGVSCTVHLPTGVGWSCVAYTKGSYLRSQLGAWEDWLNYKLYYLGNVQMQACAYLRVDTRPSGSTSYQGFITQGLPLGTNC